jgi:asparagine synthase (glutamine-hydrolysing)
LALQAMHPDLVRGLDREAVLEPTRQAFLAAEHAGEIHAQVATWVKTYMECSILTKVDRASMMHSLEVRSPYLDVDLAKTLANLPAELIFRNGRGKVLLRKLAENLLPPSLLEKKKKGFGVPQASWLRTILRDRMEAALEETRRGDGWFRYDVIAPMWRDHASGRTDYRRSLWNFLFSFPFQQASCTAPA